jgi:hypothetical protein
MKTKNKKKGDEFVYLVYCNPDPQLVYGVYKSKHDAIRYAISLIRYRKERAISKGQTFGYHHFRPLMQPMQLRWMKDKDNPSYYDMCVFTACLSIPEQKNNEWGDNACHIRVVRRVLT